MSARTAVLAALAAASIGSAAAVEFMSVAAEGAVLYDAPSTQARKLFVIERYTPVEVVVVLPQWAKVRDMSGDLTWIERSALSPQRMLAVAAAKASVRKSPELNAGIVFEAEGGVGLELIEPGPFGWARVRHLDGQEGFVRSLEVWGL